MHPSVRHGRQTAAPSCRALGVAAVLVCVVVSGCAAGSEPVVGRSVFSSRLVGRLHISPTQADCVTHEVFRAYSPTEIATIHENGIGALLPARWSPYVHAMAGCVLADGGRP